MAGVADEESGACSPNGLNYLLKQKIVGGKGTLNGEFAEPNRLIGAIYCHIGSRVTIGHRGLIRLVVSVKGQACHSGSNFDCPSPISLIFLIVHEWCMGEKGSNASMALCEALFKIEKHDWPLALYEPVCCDAV